MNFGDLKIEDLQIPSSTLGFGPADQPMNFGDQFDGRLFKPYNKNEKIGKLVEFSGTQVINNTIASFEKAQQSQMLKSQSAGGSKLQMQTT